MKKSDLIKIVAKQHPNVSQQQIALITDQFFHQLTTAIAQGKRVELRGLGSFDSRLRPPRASRNPRTGTPVAVPRQRVPFFRLGRKLKELLQVALQQNLAAQSSCAVSVVKKNGATKNVSKVSSSSANSDPASAMGRSHHVKENPLTQ